MKFVLQILQYAITFSVKLYIVGILTLEVYFSPTVSTGCTFVTKYTLFVT